MVSVVTPITHILQLVQVYFIPLKMVIFTSYQAIKPNCLRPNIFSPHYPSRARNESHARIITHVTCTGRLPRAGKANERKTSLTLTLPLNNVCTSWQLLLPGNQQNDDKIEDSTGMKWKTCWQIPLKIMTESCRSISKWRGEGIIDEKGYSLWYCNHIHDRIK